MTQSKTKFALDLSNEGVSLWHRADDASWELLGNVDIDDPDFSGKITALKNSAAQKDDLIAQIRIPRSEVFISSLEMNGVVGSAATTKIKAFLTHKTPYYADELVFDLVNTEQDSTAYVCAVTKKTLAEAETFINAQGFRAAFYTTKCDADEFPRAPRFLDTTTPVPAPAVKTPEPAPQAPASIPKEMPPKSDVAPKQDAAKEPPQDSVAKTDAAPTTKIQIPPAPPTVPKPDIVPTPDVALKEDSPKEPPQKTVVKPDEAPTTKIQIPPAPPVSPPKPPVPETPKKADTPDKPSVADKAEDKTTDSKTPTSVSGATPTSTPPSAAFSSIRNKDLIAPVRHGSKDSSPKTPPVIPAPRISIELPKNTAQAAQTNAFNMPQGRAQTFDYKEIFSPRLLMALFALLLVAGVYFSYGYIFDGKDEIAKLEATPETQVQTASVPTDLTPPTDNAAETTALNSLAKAQPTPTTLPSIAPLATPPVADAAPSFSSTPLVTAPPVASPTTPPVAPPVIVADVPKPAVQSPPAQDQVAVAPTVTTPALPQAPSLTQDPVTPAVLTQEPEPVAPLEVTPSTKGTLSPDGIMLYAGSPKIIPPLRKSDVQEIIAQTPDLTAEIKPEVRTEDLSEQAALTPTDQPATDAQETAVIQAAPEPAQPDLLALADPSLANIRPKLRPSNLAIITAPKPTLLDRADPALAGVKPRVRPKNLKIIKPEPKVDSAAINSAIEQAAQEAAEADKAKRETARKSVVDYSPSRTTKRPKTRPRNFASKVSRSKKAAVASVKTEEKQTAALTPRSARGTAKASAPTAANVQKQATERSTFSKKRLSLVGVYGKASNRRALVRLPSGRYVKVKTGQRVSGWKVSAIGENSVRMRKGSRDQVLRMPR